MSRISKPVKSIRLPCGRPSPTKNPAQDSLGDSAESYLERLNQHIQKKGLNQSDSRNKILEIILSQPQHFNVSELVDKVHQTYPHIGAATVYRNIPVFLESGLIKETLTDDQGQKVFELGEGEHHDHIVCLDCNEIFEFHEEVIESAQTKLGDRMKFQPVQHRHVIYAHCDYKRPRPK